MKYRPEGARAQCRFLDCAGGMGLAGSGICHLGGDWENPDCPQFFDETCFLLLHMWGWYFIQMGYGHELERSYEVLECEQRQMWGHE